MRAALPMYMGVGEDVAIGRDKEAGTTAALGHENAGGLLVAIFRDFERLRRDLNDFGCDGGGDALRVTADPFQFPSGIGIGSECGYSNHRPSQGCLQPKLVDHLM